jgi:hypothetical protein
MIQQIAAVASAGGGTATMQKQINFSMPEAEATKGNPEQEKHPFVEKAEKQSQEVARPE